MKYWISILVSIVCGILVGLQLALLAVFLYYGPIFEWRF